MFTMTSCVNFGGRAGSASEIEDAFVPIRKTKREGGKEGGEEFRRAEGEEVRNQAAASGQN